MSSARKHPLALLAYGLVALAIVFELGVVWVMLHPQVPEDYRAYYIDKTTTCLNQPFSGDYVFGAAVSFRPDGAEAAKPLKICGWEGPAGDGTHAVGTSSRLRFALPQGVGAVRLTLEVFALDREGYPRQRIGVDVNGVLVDTVELAAGAVERFELTVPAEVVASHPAALEVTLNYPDAISIGPNDSNSRWRSIKLLMAQVQPILP